MLLLFCSFCGALIDWTSLTCLPRITYATARFLSLKLVRVSHAMADLSHKLSDAQHAPPAGVFSLARFFLMR